MGGGGGFIYVLGVSVQLQGVHSCGGLCPRTYISLDNTITLRGIITLRRFVIHLPNCIIIRACDKYPLKLSNFMFSRGDKRGQTQLILTPPPPPGPPPRPPWQGDNSKISLDKNFHISPPTFIDFLTLLKAPI